jgi:uncharacterized protein YndB with AHSA1/START domain
MPQLSVTPLRTVALERSFDAPVDLVFEAWTRPELWSRWFPPREFTMTIEAMDFREGGTFDAAFHGFGASHAFSGTYKEIVPGERLVWASNFPDGPEGQMLTTVTFHPEGDRTRLEVVQAFFYLEGFAKQGVEGAPIGWGQTLDKLGEYLAERRAA